MNEPASLCRTRDKHKEIRCQGLLRRSAENMAGATSEEAGTWTMENNVPGRMGSVYKGHIEQLD